MVVASACLLATIITLVKTYASPPYKEPKSCWRPIKPAAVNLQIRTLWGWLIVGCGKGVTTTYGAYLGIAWIPGLLTIITWVVVTVITNQSSLAALIASVSAPIFALLFGVSSPILVFAVIGAVLIYIRHIDNIKRIIAGTENTLSQKIEIEEDDSP